MAQAAGSNSVLTGHSCTGSQAVTIRTGDTGSETWISATRGKLLHVRVCIDTIPCMNVHVHACTLITSRMCSYTESLIYNLHIIHVCRLGGVVCFFCCRSKRALQKGKGIRKELFTSKV